MGVFVWVMTGLALWHFSVFVPDRFAGGIAGAFLGALLGAVLGGLALSGFDVPGRSDTDLGTLLLAVPGTLIGMAVVYAIGIRQGQEAVHI
jgi:outer membrane lipoprotein SlyB